MPHLIIIGAGGFGLEVAAYAEDMALAAMADYTAIHGFLDDTKKAGDKHADYPILGTTDAAIDNQAVYVIAVGSPAGRSKLAEKIAARGGKFTSIVHPQTYIANSASIGAGSIVAPFAFIGPLARVGSHCVLNTHVSVGHESSTGDFSVLSPHAVVHGAATLGKNVFMGSGASIAAAVTIGDGAKISAGAVVYDAVPANATAIGNPARTRQI